MKLDGHYADAKIVGDLLVDAAARYLLEHDTYHANEPLLSSPAYGLLVGIADGLGDFFAGAPVDVDYGEQRAVELRAMAAQLARIVEETTQPALSNRG